jgi:hypothetical protein
MDRKKVFVLSLALLVLFGGVLLIARSIGKKDVAGIPVSDNKNPVTTKKESANLFGKGTEEETAKNITDAVGIVEAIGEKTITVKNAENSSVVGITGATPVVITSNNAKTISGQMADLKVGDAVKVVYDKTTKNVTMITITRAIAPEKTK